LEDLDLILDQCKQNNKNAQASLYNRLAPKLLGICVRYLQDRDEAEDVMQDSFVKIFTNIKSFKGEGSFEGWAKRIAVNTALTALKKKNKVRFERNLTIVENIDFTEEETRDITLPEILACIDVLPQGYRTIINLFMVEEYSHKEIADKLDIQESTSRSQCARARQALLKLIKEKITTEKLKNA
jgi:RNA polymerase sigma factor (sigma-70 family)